MELKIETEKNNPLLHRKELHFTIASKTPVDRAKIKDKIVALTGSNDDRVVVDKINRKYGEDKITGMAKVYSTKKALMEIENKFMVKRNKIGEKKEEPKAEEKPAEAPAEEKAE